MNKMLKFFLYSLILLSSLKLLAQNTAITGTIAQKGNATTLYLDTLGAQGTAPMLSVPLAADGSFKLEANIQRTDLYRLRISDQNFLVLILSPGEKMEFTNTGATLGENSTIKGSPQSELLLSLLTKMKKDGTLTADYLKQEINKNPGFLGWLFFMDKLSLDNDLPLILKVDAILYKSYPYIPYISQSHAFLSSYKLTAIGQPAQDIALPGVDGNILHLSSLKGKYVLLDFWASWCGPCRHENPNVVLTYRKYKDKGFDIFSVSLDKDKNNWINAISADGLVWPNHVSDLKYWNSAGAKLYGVNSIPATFLLDRDGRIIAKNLRGDDLQKKLAELLGN